MAKEQQLLFDLFFEVESSGNVPRLSIFEMRQTVLGFLSSLTPAAIGTNVAARFRKYQVAAGAYWCNDSRKMRTVKSTALVEIYTQKARCFSDCAGQVQLLSAIKELRSQKELLESEIRHNEPELQSCDDLFNEFTTWDYKQSGNTKYQTLRAKLERVQSALYHGSRLERIRNAAVADYLYLAVPANLILPEELADGWGLIYLDHEHCYSVVKEPVIQSDVTTEGRVHFALNIGAEAKSSLLFANGVNRKSSVICTYTRPPKRRRR